MAIRGVYGEEASQISLMDLLAEITGVGGDFNTSIGSAQSTRFVGGPQQMSEGSGPEAARAGPSGAAGAGHRAGPAGHRPHGHRVASGPAR